MSGGIRIGKLLGIPVYLHYTWFAIFALITVNLTIVFGSQGAYPEWSLALRSTLAAVTAVLFFASVVAHELSHSMVAVRHQIPVESITLFIFGGVARISKEAPTPRIEGMVAIAGPAMSLALALVFFLIWWFIGASVEIIAVPAFWLAYINLALGVFNLIPGFPMDGGRVLRSFLWSRSGDFTKATRQASVVGRVFGFLFMALGGAEVLLTGNLGGLWLVFIGWFIENAANTSYQQVELQAALSNIAARDVMARDVPSVQAGDSIDHLVNGLIFPLGARCLLVKHNNELVGLVSITDVRHLSQEQWMHSNVGAIMKPWQDVVTTTADAPAMEVLSKMVDHNINQVPVVYDGSVIGLVTRERLLQAVHMKTELQREQRR